MTTGVDARGEPLSGASDTAVTLYEQALAELQCYRGDPLATLDRTIAESPDFVMAHCFRAYIFILTTEARALPERGPASTRRPNCGPTPANAATWSP
jgi:hypothetical protein